MKANEEYRNDAQLRHAVLKKLIRHRDELHEAVSHMRKAYRILSLTDDLRCEEDKYFKVRSDLNAGIGKIEDMLDYILDGIEQRELEGTTAYVGNIAAFLTEDKARELKDKFND